MGVVSEEMLTARIPMPAAEVVVADCLAVAVATLHRLIRREGAQVAEAGQALRRLAESPCPGRAQRQEIAATVL